MLLSLVLLVGFLAVVEDGDDPWLPEPPLELLLDAAPAAAPP